METLGTMILNFVSRYLKVRSAVSPAWSADGQRIAFITGITGVPQVWQVALVSGSDIIPWPDQLTFGEDRVLGAWFSPAPGDDRLIFARDVGGNENAQLFLLSIDGSEEKCLTLGHENAMHLFGAWSDDGNCILFASNRRHPGLFDLYLQPLDGEAHLVWRNDDYGFPFRVCFSPDGKHAVTNRMAANFHYDLFEIELETGSAREITPSLEEGRFNAIYYAPDGRSVFLNTDVGSDFLHVARLDLDTFALEAVVTCEGDIEHCTLSRDGRFLAYTVNVAGADDLYVLDLRTGRTRSAPEFSTIPGVIGERGSSFVSSGLVFRSDGTRLAFSFTSATRASNIFVWDLEANRVRAVTRAAHGGLPLDSFVSPEIIHYPTFDGRDIPALFYKPSGAYSRPLPVVVVVHGGPVGQSRPGFNPFIQMLLRSGYAVLAPNVRGSTGYGKAYSHLDDVEKRMDSVADLAHAACWLKEQPGIDGSRLAVYGISYGGFMVLSSLTTYPDLWAAGVDIVGQTNFVTFLENTSEYRRAHREGEYGSLAHHREFLEGIAPINHLDRLAAPLMVIHGANDPRVPLSETEQLVAALKERDIPVEFLLFDDEGHGLVKLKNKLVAYSAIIKFLNTHLSNM